MFNRLRRRFRRLIPSRRDLRLWRQRMTRGWDDSETWSLDYSLAKVIAPRLKRFKELNNGHPGDMTEKQWDDILDRMIAAFEFLGSDERWMCYDNKKWNEVNEGLKLFGEYFTALWW